MFRGLDENEAPEVKGAPSIVDPLADVFKQRIEEERARMQQGDKITPTKVKVAAAEDVKRMEDAARAKRDSYVKTRDFRTFHVVRCLSMRLTGFFASLNIAGYTRIT